MRHQAIRNVHPNVISIYGDSDARDDNGNAIPIDEAKVSAEIVKLQAEYDAQEYARQRKAEYPTIEDCVHAMLDGGLDELQAKRHAVKQKYPKE